MLKDIAKSNRGKSSDKKKVKHLLPHVRKRMAAMQAQIQKINFQPYTYSSYKEKFDGKYTNLGGLGNRYRFSSQIGSNIESHEWKQAMQKKKRMEIISKSIDFVNKKKYLILANDDPLKHTLKETKDKILNSEYNINVIFRPNILELK